MCGSGAPTSTDLIAVHLRTIRSAQVHRLRIAVVFAAVRGAATIRTTSGALIVTGTTQVSGSSASASVYLPAPIKRLI